MAEAALAIIGGSGLYEMAGLTDRREITVDTPFGAPSDDIVIGSLSSTPVAFLPRHGRGHRLSPTELPVRANIYALKSLGVERIISVSAVGSLKEEVQPLDVVVPDQIIDRTRNRPNTFFGDGVVAHVGMAEPYCPELRQTVVDATRRAGATTHAGGTYLVIEGPQFSTRAESELYRTWGASVIGMTALPEAKLAREAEICYATVALVTDYDVWRRSSEPVSVEMVLGNLTRNVKMSQSIIRNIAETLPAVPGCACGTALKDAIMTSRDRISEAAKARLSEIIGAYVS